MDRRLPPHAAKPGLNPRDALDILDIRTATARRRQPIWRHRTDAGADVLHYLATHGAPATRAAVAANPGSARRSPTGSWPMTTMKMCAPNWRSRSPA